MLVCQIVFSIFLLAVQPTFASPSLDWRSDYKEALTIARQSHLPLVLFFTGSDWCGWCRKMEEEIFQDPDFIAYAHGRYLFVKLDYPMRSAQSKKIESQNLHLQEKYSVRTFPSVLVITEREEQIGLSGYQSGNGEQYALHLNQMMNAYRRYKELYSQLHQANYSGKELKRLYQQAKEFGFEGEAWEIIEKGVQSRLAPFFLTERYRTLIDAGKFTSLEAQSLRRYLLSQDPNNRHLTHYQVALIDFQQYCEQAEEGRCSVEAAVAPLTKYVAQFGDSDPENLWRIYTVISQAYLERDCYAQALYYTKKSLSTAPDHIRPEIVRNLKIIELELSYQRH